MRNSFWRVVLVIFVSMFLAVPSYGDKLDTDVRNIEIGVVAAAAAVVVALILVAHYAARPSITGCVHSGTNGATITDEKNQRVYALSGNMAGIADGKRLKLKAKELKSHGPDSTPALRVAKVAKDLGACPI